jgi:hypothetical protein
VAGHLHLHSDPTEATYKDIVEVFESRCRDLQLAAAYGFQFKARTQVSKEFAAAIKQLNHWALVGLSQYHGQREAASAFVE